MQQYRQMSLRELCRLQDEILQEHLKRLLPSVMEETGTDMWIVIGDEYNEGPTGESLLPSSFHHARRTAAFIFSWNGTNPTRMVVSKPDYMIAR